MLKPLGDALAGWVPHGRPGGDPLTQLAAAWPSVVGERIAAQARPVEIHGTTLVVATRSSAWSQQLSFLHDRILAEVAARGIKIENLRFRTGLRPARNAMPARLASRTPSAQRPLADQPEPHDPIARLRQTIAASTGPRCRRCSAPTERAGDCAPCRGARRSARVLGLQRLLYEMPWFGLTEAKAATPELTAEEFDSARRELLARWWTTLQRAKFAGRLSADGAERRIAMCYVLVQSRLRPDAVSPATIRNLLGVELVTLLFPTGEPNVGKASPHA
ncbi:MAG: DciA family protein [Vulcanimicrobiaceae bacterium]